MLPLKRPLHPARHSHEPADRAAAVLRTARQVVVVTGAGISAASGIATYRSDGSRWDDPQLESMMRADTYRQHLPLLWRHWHRLRGQIAAAEPNPAHRALVDWDRRLQASGGSVTVVTQNVDDLHERAGSRLVEKLHGDVTAVRCMSDHCEHGRTLGPLDADRVPHCTGCGQPQRPDITLFDERLDPLAHHRAKRAIRFCDAVVFVGTSGMVRSAARLHEFAPDAAPRVLINRDPWQRGGEVFDLVLLGDAEQVLPLLV